MPDQDLTARIEAVESRLAIQQLPIRYAMAVDSRDLDAWVGCFRPDVDAGRHGTGREALRRFIEPQLRTFYRSIHLICGHRVDLVSPERATGAVYCRAEHEVADRWVVMGICYTDEYARVDGEWFFSRRRERHWYAADVTRTPQSVGFAEWGRGVPGLPQGFPSWAPFWDEDQHAGAVTSDPAPSGTLAAAPSVPNPPTDTSRARQTRRSSVAR